MPNMADSTKITKISDVVSANTGDVNSSGVDMSGYEGALFLSSYGTAASDNILHIEQSDDDGSSDAYSALTGTDVGAGSSDEDQWLDIYRPLKKWLRCVAERGTSTTLENIWVIQYGARNKVVDNTTAGTIHGETHISPIEGTA